MACAPSKLRLRRRNRIWNRGRCRSPRLTAITVKFIPVPYVVVALAAAAFLVAFGAHRQANSRSDEISHAYLGFDRNIYPGDAALPALRKTFVFTSYWLSPPPGEKINTWLGKREFLRSL